MMNSEAKRLGMTSTRFRNANGLPDNGQYTTARDLAVLAQAIWTEFPEYREYFRIPAIKAGKKILRSQNMLLERYRGTVGMKTGFVCASGFNMIAVAERYKRTMIAVVLGADSAIARGELAAHLLDEGFSSWLRVGRTSLDTFAATRSTTPVADLHDIVCPKKSDQTAAGEEEDAPEDQLFPHSSLVPRFVLMDPVPVYTGRTEAPGKKTPGKAVPIPHLRPTSAGIAGGSASAYVSPEKALQTEFQ
jgi:D-alanyl-D-alanine carboxypeptidase